MDKNISRRVFLKITGFASVVCAGGCSKAFAGSAESQTLPGPVLAYRRVVKSKDIHGYLGNEIHLGYIILTLFYDRWLSGLVDHYSTLVTPGMATG